MWLSLSNAFLSIVQPSPADEAAHPGTLLVRARRPGDIESVFGDDTVVQRRPERDYLFRAFIGREVVATIIADQVMDIFYSNFKNSVRDDRLHTAYARVWSVMAALQPTPPYHGPVRAAPARRNASRKLPL